MRHPGHGTRHHVPRGKYEILTLFVVATVGPDIAVLDDNLLDLLWSITVAIFVLFGMIGAIVSGKVADHFGR